MKSRTHLFFVAGQTAFGEAVLGLRVAHELHARGDHVVVLSDPSLAVLTEGTPFKTIPVPAGEQAKAIDKLIAKTAADVRADSVILLDTSLVYRRLASQRADATFLRTVSAPVIGLDPWNTRETGLTWDLCGTTLELPRHSLDVKNRLVPVPFVHPVGSPGLYDALPQPFALDDDDREDIRADFGVGKEERLLLLCSARWQHPSTQAHELGRRLATTLPALAAELIARAGPKVRVVHVGPEAYAMPALGKRYTWLSPRTPARFAKILASADLLLTFNFSATAVVSAIASGLPVLLGVNSYAGDADTILAKLPERPSPAMRSWLSRAAPLPPYRVWPLGLHKFLAPFAVNNPYTTALRTVEVLEETAFVEAMRSLLFDEAARTELRDAQRAYRAEVAKLPKAADLVATYLKG